MSAETPLTAAWNRVRETVSDEAADRRADGRTVVEAYADHGAVRPADDGPLTIAFTVPADAATALRDAFATAAIDRTEVRYVDADGHRLYALEVVRADGSAVAYVAGGVSRRRLRDRADTTGPARTVVRTLDDAVAVEFRHDERTPFLAGLR